MKRFSFYSAAAPMLLLAASSCGPIIGIPEREDNVDIGTAEPSLSTAGSNDNLSTEDADPCVAFCQGALKVCTGDYAVYHNEPECLVACHLMDDELRECRAEELHKAEFSQELAVHCHALSLGGSSKCGGNCANYCSAMGQVCTGSNRDSAEQEDCERKCEALADHEEQTGLPASASLYNAERDHEGDTIQCRLVHLAIAAAVDADGHCWHAALAPRRYEDQGGVKANPCATGFNELAPRCQDYCHVVTIGCTGAHRVYSSEAQCLAVCEKLHRGEVTTPAKDDDSVACRVIHAYNAIMYDDPATHCPHAGPGGAGVCGTDCPAYCALLNSGCNREFRSAFDSSPAPLATCEQACEARKKTPKLHYSVAAASGPNADPIACGLYYLSRALEEPAKAAEYCESAVGRGQCVP